MAIKLAAAADTMITVSQLSHLGLTSCAAELADLLVEVVNGGPSMGFIAPLPYDEAYSYWLSLRAQLRAGTRLVLVIRMGDQIVGTGQLALAGAPNARHRAEVQKVFVSAELRGCGLGKRIVTALHDVARLHARMLLLLTTPYGSPAEFMYRSLGYRSVGVIPGFGMGPRGERYDAVSLYIEL
jgi:GNAT superfamily N-acetyltransferase